MKTRASFSATLKSQTLKVGMFMSCMAVMGSAAATTLPKGNCADPKPYTDLRHCKFKKANLSNKNLEGVDMRGVELYKTQLQGANLTKALFSGRSITHASLDGAIGLPTEALAIFKTFYLATPNKDNGFTLTSLPHDYTGNIEQVAGLDNLNLAQNNSETQSTIALLSYPRYGDSQRALILARFDNNQFDRPACYQSTKPFNKEGQDYYYGTWESLKTRKLKDGAYLIGALAHGADGDELGTSEWFKVVLLKFSSTCKLTILHDEYLSRGGDSVERNGKYDEEWCGGELDYRFIDDQTAEIKTTIPASSKKVCGDAANPREKILTKQIKLNLR